MDKTKGEKSAGMRIKLPLKTKRACHLRKELLPLGKVSMQVLRRMWADDQGQDIAEYAVMLAVILVIVVGTIHLIGSNANNVFSNVASSLTQ